jgi:hypothetical protein
MLAVRIGAKRRVSEPEVNVALLVLEAQTIVFAAVVESRDYTTTLERMAASLPRRSVFALVEDARADIRETAHAIGMVSKPSQPRI